jgi:DNA-binding LytR/AlgR family response regulator
MTRKSDPMFRIGICEDERIICSEIERIILDYSKYCLVTLQVEVFYSGEELCNCMKAGAEFDMIFLDIELKQMNGVEVGKYIRETLQNDVLHLVYISAKDSYYLELFDVRPMHFLHKPILPEKLIKDIDKAIELSKNFEHTYTYQHAHVIYKKSIKDILYFETNGRKVKIVTTSGENIFYGRLKEIYEEMKEYHFFFVHQSYLVNYIHIVEFGHKEIKLSNNTVLPISRQKREQVLDIFMNFEREGL